jgi:hypothetical protein
VAQRRRHVALGRVPARARPEDEAGTDALHHLVQGLHTISTNNNVRFVTAARKPSPTRKGTWKLVLPNQGCFKRLLLKTYMIQRNDFSCRELVYEHVHIPTVWRARFKTIGTDLCRPNPQKMTPTDQGSSIQKTELIQLVRLG